MAYNVPGMNLADLYNPQAGSVYGKKRRPTMPLAERMEAEKPGYQQMISDMTGQWVKENQFRENMELMQQQLEAQKDAASASNWIGVAGLGLQAGKLGFDVASLAGLFKG